VPVLYAIFVLDLKLVKWETLGEAEHHAADDFAPLGNEAMTRKASSSPAP
jgi:hypothetical protein